MVSEVKNMDCMEFMKQFPDKFFDLAVVDPPYGIGEDGAKNHSRGKCAEATKYTPKQWDKAAPDEVYFKELMRVSKNQIIWGANHFISRMPYNSSCWLVWDKLNGNNDFADCELAWTSFKKAVRRFVFRWAGMLQGNMKDKEIRIHPTQKPKALYAWIFENFARGGQKILDTHLGSGSSRIAAYHAGLDFYGCELDKEYFDKANERFEKEIHGVEVFGNTVITQQSLFD
jgi:site-specific DNA-methyltransferase (adenine-specific)